MLSVAELKKLIKAHNVLSKIKLPPKADKTALLKLLADNNYMIDEDKKVIKPSVKRGKQITLKKAEEVVKEPKKAEPKSRKAILVKEIEKELRTLEVKHLETILKKLTVEKPNYNEVVKKEEEKKKKKKKK